MSSFGSHSSLIVSTLGSLACVAGGIRERASGGRAAIPSRASPASLRPRVNSRAAKPGLFTNPLTASPLAFTASLPKQKHSRAKSRYGLPFKTARLESPRIFVWCSETGHVRTRKERTSSISQHSQVTESRSWMTWIIIKFGIVLGSMLRKLFQELEFSRYLLITKPLAFACNKILVKRSNK